MAEIGNPVTLGRATTIDAVDEFVVCGVGITGSVVSVLLQFDGDWAGTLTFGAARRVYAADGTDSLVWDIVQATDATTGTAASTTNGGASTDEIHRIDASGFDAVRVYGTTVTTGTVNVTFGEVMA